MVLLDGVIGWCYWMVLLDGVIGWSHYICAI